MGYISSAYHCLFCPILIIMINITMKLCFCFLFCCHSDLVIGDIEGFADDYSSLISALLDLYESSHAPKWLEWAMSLQETQDWLFWDSKGGGYFSSSGKDKRVLIQMKEGLSYKLYHMEKEINACLVIWL